MLGIVGVVVVGGVLAVVAVVFGNGPAHTDDIVSSCDLRSGSTSSDSQVCMDLTTVNDKVKEICSKYKLSKKSCDRKGSLGGCASHGTISWHYPDARHKTANDVKKDCSDTFVTPSWQ